MIVKDFGKFMRAFTVSALLEGYRVEETIHAVSIHHAIKIMKAKYGNSARNIYVLNQLKMNNLRINIIMFLKYYFNFDNLIYGNISIKVKQDN